MSKRFRVKYAPEALDDLRAIYSYIAFRLKERGTAARQVERIQREIRGLREMPERYASMNGEPWVSMGIRKLPVDNYLVLYLVDSTKQLVIIARVFYGGRDLEHIILN